MAVQALMNFVGAGKGQVKGLQGSNLLSTVFVVASAILGLTKVNKLSAKFIFSG